MQENKSTLKVIPAQRYSGKEKMTDQEFTQLKVDVGVTKAQIASIITLCDKMDKVIERLIDGREKMLDQIYEDMAEESRNTKQDMKELNKRIDTVEANLSSKLESIEDKVMAEIKSLKSEFKENSTTEQNKIDKILEWKWMAAGGILVLSWLLSKAKFDILTKLLNS